MALVSISEAARLVGKSRSTLYRGYIDTGKLSLLQDSATGKPVVDISELIRVFGQLRATGKLSLLQDSFIQNATPQKDSEISLLRELLKTKDEQLAAASEREEWMRKQVEELTSTIKQIQHKPGNEEGNIKAQERWLLLGRELDMLDGWRRNLVIWLCG
jgi:hypothetical protein